MMFESIAGFVLLFFAVASGRESKREAERKNIQTKETIFVPKSNPDESSGRTDTGKLPESRSGPHATSFRSEKAEIKTNNRRNLSSSYVEPLSWSLQCRKNTAPLAVVAALGQAQ